MIDYDEIVLEEEKSQNIAIERRCEYVYKSERELAQSIEPDPGRVHSRLLRQWVTSVRGKLESTTNKNAVKMPCGTRHFS